MLPYTKIRKINDFFWYYAGWPGPPPVLYKRFDTAGLTDLNVNVMAGTSPFPPTLALVSTTVII